MADEIIKDINPNIKAIEQGDGTFAMAGARRKGGVLSSGIKSADTVIKAQAGAVYWLTVSDTANLAIELNDSPTGVGIDRWGFDLPSGGYAHFIFDPPLEFATGIYLDVSTVTCKVTVGYI